MRIKLNLDYHKNAIKNYFEKVDMPEGVYLAGGALTSMFRGQLREYNILNK